MRRLAIRSRKDSIVTRSTSLKEELIRDLTLQVLVNADGPLDAVEVCAQSNLVVSVPDALKAIQRLREEGVAVDAEPDPIRMRYVAIIH